MLAKDQAPPACPSLGRALQPQEAPTILPGKRNGPCPLYTPQGSSKGSGCPFPDQELLCGSSAKVPASSSSPDLLSAPPLAYMALSSSISLGNLRDEMWED